METILIEAPKGIRPMLSELLEPISTKVTQGSQKHTLVFEFIGTLRNPLELIHTLDSSLFQHIQILSIY